MPSAKQRAKKRAAKAAAQAAATNAAQAVQSKAVAPCPLAAAKKAEEDRIAKAYDELAQNGHAVQRHGEAITQQQLADRAVKGFDPVTGSTQDAYRKGPGGAPATHLVGRHATKFASKEAMVKAVEAVKKHPDFAKELDNAKKNGETRFAVDSVKLEDALGSNYKDQVSGVTRQGSKNNPTGSVPTDFTDGKLTAVFEKDNKGNWNVLTMYPNPKA